MRPPAASLRPPFVDFGRAATGIRAAADALERRYRVVLAALVLAQWLGVLAIALLAEHDGWLYHHGGDGTWYWTGAYELGHLRIPYAAIGFGYPILLAPAGAVLGPSLLSGLPVAILFNVVVLLPLALLFLYGVAERIAGRLFGLLTAALWIVVPLLAYRGFRPGDARPGFLDVFLPGGVGLNGVGDFPSMVACLGASYFVLRALASLGRTDALLAGLLTAYAIGIKPANALFLPAPLLALAAARRWQLGRPFVAGLALPLLTLALWKYRGLGELPLLHSALPEQRLALGPQPVAGLFGHYGGIDFGLLQERMRELREIFWSKALVEWIPIAGAFALLRRSPPGGLLVAAWFWAYILVKGTSQYASVYSMTFFRLVEPAFPAFVLLGASFVFLIPTVRRRATPVAPPPAGRRPAIAAVVVLGVLPLLLVASARPVAAGTTARSVGSGVEIVVRTQQLQASVDGDVVKLTWRGGDSAYRVFRTAPADTCTQAPPGVPECYYTPLAQINVERPSATDRPGPGTWAYRVAPTADPTGDVNGDPLVLSEPVTVKVP